MIDKNIRKKGVISNGRFYCNYESQDTGDTALSVYDREGNIVLDIAEKTALQRINGNIR